MDKRRNNYIIYSYSRGKTLQELGDEFGLTRERVRQIIARFGKIEGGVTIRSRRKVALDEAKRDVHCLEKRGCTWKQYVALRAMRRPTRAFSQQRRNASDRGIRWELTLWEWWCIWKESGHWEERGRDGGAYVMCRFGDVGPYAVDNIYIATSNQNGRDMTNRFKLTGAKPR